MSLKIGVVDSGFRPDQSDWIVDSAYFYLEEGALWMADPEPDSIDHGARIIDIIHHHYPQAEFFSAQVFDKRGITSPAQVAAAVNWLVEQKVEMINMSLGLRQDREVLSSAIAAAIEKGIIICASSPARGEPVYPSAYPGVLRMTGDARCSMQEISCLETEFADFGGHVMGMDQEQARAGSSLGSAHMAGHVARVMAEQGRMDVIKLGNKLKQLASYFGPERRLY